jgi:hypothetical protein
LAGVGATGQTQTSSAQMLLGRQAGSSTTGIVQDLFALKDGVCLVNGVCCYTNLCNNSYKFSFNAIALGFALMLSLILIR